VFVCPLKLLNAVTLGWYWAGGIAGSVPDKARPDKVLFRTLTKYLEYAA
jgi:hypothetical protein